MGETGAASLSAGADTFLATMKNAGFVQYFQQNVDLLGAVSGNHVTMRCYATTQGVRSPRIDLIKNHLVSAFNVESANGFFFEAVPDSCEAFWNEYGDVLVQ